MNDPYAHKWFVQQDYQDWVYKTNTTTTVLSDYANKQIASQNSLPTKEPLNTKLLLLEDV